MAEHNNLKSLFSDIADAIREKNGSTDTIVADNFPSVIAAIDTQEDLDPELADQDAKIAELQELLQGKAVPAPEDLTEELAAQSEIIAEQDELITQLASAIEGKASVTYPTLSNPASPENIESGYEAIDGNGNVVTGTMSALTGLISSYGTGSSITNSDSPRTLNTGVVNNLVSISSTFENPKAIVILRANGLDTGTTGNIGVCHVSGYDNPVDFNYAGSSFTAGIINDDGTTRVQITSNSGNTSQRFSAYLWEEV